jgi:heme oxygenase (biliverdin-producing, ferredoxin)
MLGELSLRLRAETHTLHRQVECSAFVTTLLSGRMPKAVYNLLLRNLEPIYFELEAGMVLHSTHPGIRPVFHPTLFRVQALRRDLDLLHGESWRDDLPVSNACAVYVARLRYLQKFEPELLAAHAYVRYLGDLSGGQRLGAIVARSFCLPINEGGNRGVDFYNFGELEEVLSLSKAFRAGIDTLKSDGILVEAMLAFEIHGQLFEELAAYCGLPALLAVNTLD